MGSFSNGTEGEQYEEEYCEKCLHQIDENGNGCPVWGLHLNFSYDLCNEKGTPGKTMLDALIPVSKNGLYNEKCTMFTVR